MKSESRKFHLHVLSLHAANLYDSLIYQHNLLTDTVKEFTMLDKHKDEWTSRGFLAIKEVDGQKTKYFIQENFIQYLPIRANETQEFFLVDNSKAKSIINVVKNPKPFKITPSLVFDDMHKFIDDICPFDHSNPDQFTFLKLNAIQGYLGKTLTCVCGTSEFGKTSVYEFVHAITQKSPVFKPRSAAGALVRITEDGNLIIDESQESNVDIKRIIEDLAMQIGDDRPMYHNGALKSGMTKLNYNITRQSMTFLYNILSNYRDEKYFFENLWDNKIGMDSRFLKFKVDGVLKEQFDKEFDMLKEARDNQDYYIKVAKQFAYLKNLRLSNSYKRRYKTNSRLSLKGRKRDTYNEITWIIDLYCRNQEEYNKFIEIMDKCIIDYQDMIGGKVYLNPQISLTQIKPEPVKQEDTAFTKFEVTEEMIEDRVEIEKPLAFDERVMVWRKCDIDACTEVECNQAMDDKYYCRKHFK